MSRININKGKVGTSTLGGYERTSALVGSWGVIEGASGSLEIGKPVQFGSLAEAEGYGIAANALLHHHVSEYFRMAAIGGSGASLWLLNTQAHSSFELLVKDATIKQMIAAANGNIFQIAFDRIPEGETYVDGLNEETLPAMKAAQALADWCTETKRPLHTVVSGADYKGPAAAALNLRDIQENGITVELPQVSLCIAQDWDFAETLPEGPERNYAAVGTLLGCMAAQPVSYNVGEVAVMPLTNAVRGLWINAGISNHSLVKEYEAELDTLNTKGYIVGEYYSTGVCFNDDHVCTPVIVDDEGNMNEHTIALSRTNAKVFRELYNVYEPLLKRTVPVDATTGLLPLGLVKDFEQYGDDVFGRMQNAQELSGGETTVDPQSNLLYGDKELKVFYEWVPMGNIGRISGTVNIRRALS